ncbi:MAG: hypothetical protein RXN93_06470 [Thermocladium sp.]|jgi:multisubunit Na+/H+ antiporter MnhE subunit
MNNQLVIAMGLLLIAGAGLVISAWIRISVTPSVSGFIMGAVVGAVISQYFFKKPEPQPIYVGNVFEANDAGRIIQYAFRRIGKENGRTAG